MSDNWLRFVLKITTGGPNTSIRITQINSDTGDSAITEIDIQEFRTADSLELVLFNLEEVTAIRLELQNCSLLPL